MIKLFLHKKTGSGRRLAALLLAFLLTACVLSATTFPVARTAQAFGVISEPDAQAREILDGIFGYLKASYGATDLQGVIDQGFAANTDYVSGEWYVFALSQYDCFDFSSYHRTLHRILDSYDRVLFGVELEKYALLDLAMGLNVNVDMRDLAGSVGAQGIMSYVFGLHLLNNGLELSGCTAEETISALLSMQLSDGGWAISGAYGDVDVTAMTLQALVPYIGHTGTATVAADGFTVAANGSSVSANGSLVSANGSPMSANGSSVSANGFTTSAGATVGADLVERSGTYPLAPAIPAELSAEVAAAAERAIAFLASRQNDDAGFSSYGAANAESCAQVLVTLSALGIDACADPRFVKDGRTVLDALADYRLADGSFAHAAGGESNLSATQQACYASVAYLRFRGGQPPLYDLDAVRGQNEPITPSPGPTSAPTSAPTTVPTDAVREQNEPTTPSPGSTPAPYRLWGSGILAVLAIIGFAVLALRRRLTRRNGILLAAVIAILAALLWFVRIQTPEQYYASLAVSDEEAAGSVTLSIRCDTVAGIDGLPADGVMLEPVKIAFREGDTVFDALSAAAAKANLPLDIGSGSTYIRSIGTLREFAYGPLSGWMYYVNGEAPTESCGQRKLRDGDVIEWRYTRDMGSDTEDFSGISDETAIRLFLYCMKEPSFTDSNNRASVITTNR